MRIKTLIFTIGFIILSGCNPKTHQPNIAYTFENNLITDRFVVSEHYDSAKFVESRAVLSGYIDETSNLTIVEMSDVYQVSDTIVILSSVDSTYKNGPSIIVIPDKFMPGAVPFDFHECLHLDYVIHILRNNVDLLPHTDFVTLVKPTVDTNPCFIFGESDAEYVKVDAISGAIL